MSLGHRAGTTVQPVISQQEFLWSRDFRGKLEEDFVRLLICYNTRCHLTILRKSAL